MKRSRYCSEATNAVVCVWLVLLLLPTTEANASPVARTRSRFMAAKQLQQPQPQEQQQYRTESNTNDTREEETTFMNGETVVSARNKRNIVPSGDGTHLLY